MTKQEIIVIGNRKLIKIKVQDNSKFLTTYLKIIYRCQKQEIIGGATMSS